MKYLLLVTGFLFFSITILHAQTKLPGLDRSPMDMSYYPDQYPLLIIQDKVTEPLVARIIYSRPQKKGRVVFGDLLEYGKVWRLGANEATEINFYTDVKVNDKIILKGRYSMYCIPNVERWTIIINKQTDTWGSYKYNDTDDIIRMDLPVQKQTEITEEFVMAFEKSATGADLIIAWDDVKLNLPIVF